MANRFGCGDERRLFHLIELNKELNSINLVVGTDGAKAFALGLGGKDRADPLDAMSRGCHAPGDSSRWCGSAVADASRDSEPTFDVSKESFADMV